MKIDKLQAIAKGKGLRLDYSPADECYVMYDRRTGDALMLYNDFSLKMMDDRGWRTECNKLRPNN